jgi:hypothetical protein
MQIDKQNFEEIMELLKMIIEDDIFIKERINKIKPGLSYNKLEIEKTISEVSSITIKKDFEIKLKNFDQIKKKELMLKYGELIFSDRIIKSVLDKRRHTNRVYSYIKKFY